MVSFRTACFHWITSEFNFGKVHKRKTTCVSITWAAANKLELCVAALRQRLARLLGDDYSLAVSNMQLLLGGQTKHKKKQNGGVISSWPVSRPGPNAAT